MVTLVKTRVLILMVLWLAPPPATWPLDWNHFQGNFTHNDDASPLHLSCQILFSVQLKKTPRIYAAICVTNSHSRIFDDFLSRIPPLCAKGYAPQITEHQSYLTRFRESHSHQHKASLSVQTGSAECEVTMAVFIYKETVSHDQQQRITRALRQKTQRR